MGTAGTGKSYTIAAISQQLTQMGKKVKRAAFTGKAALLIRGSTLHHLFKLHRLDPHLQLSDAAIHQLREDIGETSVFILDEFSMISSQLLFKIHCVLSQIVRDEESKQKPFGGYSIILVGDMAQLPPVSATPIYQASASKWTTEGHQIYLEFKKVVILDKMMRQLSEENDTR